MNDGNPHTTYNISSYNKYKYNNIVIFLLSVYFPFSLPPSISILHFYNRIVCTLIYTRIYLVFHLNICTYSTYILLVVSMVAICIVYSYVHIMNDALLNILCVYKIVVSFWWYQPVRFYVYKYLFIYCIGKVYARVLVLVYTPYVQFIVIDWLYFRVDQNFG